MISFCQIMYSFIRSGVFVWALSDFAPKSGSYPWAFVTVLMVFVRAHFLTLGFSAHPICLVSLLMNHRIDIDLPYLRSKILYVDV